MDLILRRTQYRPDGIFGILSDEYENEIAITLEHAYYDLQTNAYVPKIRSGNYQCIKGMHRLHTKPVPFETYQVMDVEGHSNILFHWGNSNSDSDGCILLGEKIMDIGLRPQMISNSRVTFKKFIDFEAGAESFWLLVFA